MLTETLNGTELELNVFLDGDMARIEFEDCFKVYTHAGYRSTLRLFYTGAGWEEFPDTVSECYDLSMVTRREARNFVVDTLTDEFTTAREVVENCRYYHDGDWLAYLVELMDEEEFITVFDEEERPAIGEFKYEIAGVTGYTQGDYAEVMYDPEVFGENTNAHRLFENLLYDAPVFARLTVDGSEYFIDELLENSYSWDRGEVMRLVRTEYATDLDEEIIEWVCEQLPEYPEYV
jgi:hypothetical protein